MIPDKAVEAAAEEVVRIFDGDFSGEASVTMARWILEAAAPHLMAQAWDECVASDTAWINPYRKPADA